MRDVAVADLSDETLMAYADGVLDPALREAVESALRDHPEYRAKVEKFRRTRAPIRHAFVQGPLPEQPDGLIDELQRFPLRPIEATSPPSPSAGWRSDGRKRGYGQVPAVPLPMAIAASVALLIGVGLGWTLQPKGNLSPGAQSVIAFGERGLTAQGALRQLLETVQSGTTIATVSNGHTWQLKASFTFRSLGGASCRRYEMAEATNAPFAGYACRGDDGQWLVQAHLRSEGSTNNSKVFVPSAGLSDAALDAAIDAARDGDVLDFAQENKLIENAWHNSRR